jgi:hypothetical protein
VSLRQTSRKFAGEECEPYILPLFEGVATEMMGKNISLLCKALGSHDIKLSWRLPHKNKVAPLSKA